MPPLPTHRVDPRRLVDEFATRMPGVAHVILVSPEGLRVAQSHRLPIERADQLAAAASGMLSLTRGAARCFQAGAIRETVVSMDQGVMITMPIEDGSSLVALAAPNCDLGHIAFELSRFADRLFRLPPPPQPQRPMPPRDEQPHTVQFQMPAAPRMPGHPPRW